MRKKHIFLYELIILFGVFILAGCSKNINFLRKDKVPTEASVDVPKIKYVKEKREVFKNSDRKKEFEDLYGFGKYSDAIKITDALGNIASTEFGDFDLGISLKKSDIAKGAVTACISYFDKDKEKLENGKDIEYGPIWVDEPKIISNITFDKLSSESGDMLLVSLSVVSKNDQYSSYYIYNKHMTLIDYLSFSNSIDKISVSLNRRDTMTYPNGNLGKSGSLEEAVAERVAVEKEILEEIDQTYGIEREEVFQSFGEGKIPVANFPKDHDKVLKMLTIETLTNVKNFPAEKGYFKIY